MLLGWIDFSKDERNKVLNAIHLLDEPGAVDELGIGAVRDAFADLFFPGTSTVQTRAKYFLIVPYVLKEAGSGKYGSDLKAILYKIDKEERSCRDIMIKTSNDGVIGSSVPNSWVLRTPSNIYWNGIRQMGIFNEDLSIKEYIRQSIIQRSEKKATGYGNRDKNAEENEKDDIDAGDITSIRFWNLGDTYHSDWRDGLTIELLPKEAEFLKSQIIANQRTSLFAFILEKNISLDEYDSFSALCEGIKDSVDDDMRCMMELANDFNNLVSIITTRYNLIVFNNQNERARKKWDVLSKDLERRSKVDLEMIFARLSIKSVKLKTFLFNVRKAIQDNKIATVDDLIKEREVSLKGAKRAKTSRVGEFKEESVGWIGIDILDYRYTPAKRIIKDIMSPKAV